jgi:hypothetical protein
MGEQRGRKEEEEEKDHAGEAGVKREKKETCEAASTFKVCNNWKRMGGTGRD